MNFVTASWVAALGLLAAGDTKVAEVGDAPAHAFKTPMINGMGTKDLAALQGRPVLVEFWGTY